MARSAAISFIADAIIALMSGCWMASGAFTSGSGCVSVVFTSSDMIVSMLVFTLSETMTMASASAIFGCAPSIACVPSPGSSGTARPNVLRKSTPSVLGSAGCGVSDSSYIGHRLIWPSSRCTRCATDPVLYPSFPCLISSRTSAAYDLALSICASNHRPASRSSTFVTTPSVFFTSPRA